MTWDHPRAGGTDAKHDKNTWQVTGPPPAPSDAWSSPAVECPTPRTSTRRTPNALLEKPTRRGSNDRAPQHESFWTGPRARLIYSVPVDLCRGLLRGLKWSPIAGLGEHGVLLTCTDGLAVHGVIDVVRTRNA